MSFDFHTDFITGVMVGIEFEFEPHVNVMVLDLLILRVTVYQWKDDQHDSYKYA